MQASRKNTRDYLKTLKSSLCAACLCSDRKLFVLAELRGIYKRICKNFARVTNSDIFLCWECLALLRNVKRFQEKVEQSQKTLESSAKDDNKKQLKNFSHLSTTTLEVYYLHGSVDNELTDEKIAPKLCDFNESLDDELKDEETAPELYDFNEDEKVDPDIKEENEEFPDDLNLDFEPLGEIKNDSPPESLKELEDTPNECLNINTKTKDEVQEKFVNSIIFKDESIYKTNLIPKENTDEHQSNSFDNIDIPISLGTVKEELQDKTKTERLKKKTKQKQSIGLFNKRDRSELYKIIRPKNSWVNKSKRIAIQPKDLQYWLERERNSAYYKGKQNRCGKCLMRVVLSSKREHEKRHNERLPYICDICELQYASKKRLAQHLKTHYFIRSCTICEFKCIDKLYMYNHLKKQHSVHRKVQCLRCETILKSTWEFYEHYKSTHYVPTNSFICDYCNKECKQKHVLEKHILTRHMPHICPKCGQSFKKPHNLKYHIDLKHHIERTEASYCVTCDLQFDNVLQFKKHLVATIAHASERKYDTKKKSYRCPACPNVYAKRTSMKNHYNKIHTEKARFRCEDCDKNFLDNIKLRKHIKYTHEGCVRERKHICTICGRGFTIFLTNVKLRDHIKYKHEGCVKERKHICTICGRGFTEKPVLIKHVRTHTGERPYECTQCEAKFAQRSAMVTHVRNIHEKKGRKAQAT